MVRDGHRTRLRSWKEVATFFGADVRTVKRWEQTRGLPIHRPPGEARATVFAYTDELSRWLEQATAVEAPSETVEAPVSQPMRAVPPSSRSRVRLALAASLVLAATGALGWAATRQPSATATVANDEAAKLYATGVFHLETRSARGLELAQRYLTGAIARRPDFAEAYARLAETYEMMQQFADLPADEAHARAREAAHRAVTLDPASARGHAILGLVAWNADHDMPAAQRSFARALKLAPESAPIHLWYAMVLMHTGDQRVPLAEVARAQQLDPASRTILANRALILFHAGQAAEAETILRELEEAEPTLRSPPEYLATIYLAEGRWADYLRETRVAARVAGDQGRLADTYRAEAALTSGGAPAMLRAMLASQRRGYAEGRVPAFKLAQIEAMNGDRRGAIDLLGAAFARREPDVLGILLEPALKPLRGDPAFGALVRRAGLTVPVS